MILFPQPRHLELSDGTCSMLLCEEYRELTAFFKAIRSGLAGVSVSFSPLLDREEYHLTIDIFNIFKAIVGYTIRNDCLILG